MIHNVRDPGEIFVPIRTPDEGGLYVREGDIIKVTRKDKSVNTFVAVGHDNTTEYKCAKCDGSRHTGTFNKYCLADRIGFLCSEYCFKLVDSLLEEL